ncbi:hypothetical protein [Streptomyces sp. CA-106131]
MIALRDADRPDDQAPHPGPGRPVGSPHEWAEGAERALSVRT